jgi:hypothetical protein
MIIVPTTRGFLGAKPIPINTFMTVQTVAPLSIAALNAGAGSGGIYYLTATVHGLPGGTGWAEYESGGFGPTHTPLLPQAGGTPVSAMAIANGMTGLYVGTTWPVNPSTIATRLRIRAAQNGATIGFQDYSITFIA